MDVEPVDILLAALGAVALGAELFRNWVLPFEVVSVLLLAALVGAIVVSRPDVGAER